MASNPDSLEALTATVNQALTETGRFFRSSGSVQSQAQLKRGIPVAHAKFQFALDNLSEQIFLAKAFLERDYEAIRATKEETQEESQENNQPGHDVTMGEEADVKLEPEPAAPAPEQTAPAIEIKQEPQPTKTETEATPTNQPPPPPEPSQLSEPEQPVKTEKPDETTTPAMPEGTAETKAEPGGNGTRRVNEFDLHLDFGDDEIGNQNFLLGSNLGATTTGDGAQGTPEAHDSSAVTAGGDMFDMELQKVGPIAESGGEGGDQGEGQATSQPAPPMGFESQGGETSEDVMGPGESSFDDLFMGSENFGGEGDQGLLEGDGLMNMSELDDNWFT